MSNVDSRKGISDTDDIKDEDSKIIYKSRGLTGLQNLGNTCFMNAALQALSNCPQLTQYMLVHGPDIVKGDLAKSYARLIKEMWDPDKPTLVVPNYILQSIREACPFFKGYRQQEDVQEFLRCFLGQLHDEVKEVIDVDDIKGDKKAKHFVMNKDRNNESDDDENKDVGNDDDSIVNKEGDEDEERLEKDKKERKKEQDDENEDEEEENLEDEQKKDPDDVEDKFYRDREDYFRSLETRAYAKSQSRDKLQKMNSPISKRVKLKSKRVNLKRESERKQKQKAKKVSTRYRSIISDLFDGKILSSVQCRTCDNISTTIEIFQDLSLPIPNKDNLNLLKMTSLQSIKGGEAPCEKESNSANGLTRGNGYSNRLFSTLSQITNLFRSIPSIHNLFWTWLDWIFSFILGPSATLQDCLFAFFSTDELKGDDMYHCDKCKKLRNGVKLSQVLLLPEILCIHLKRFRHERMHPSKISNHVTFPLTGLDMSPFMANRAKTLIQSCSNQEDKEEDEEEDEEDEDEDEEEEEEEEKEKEEEETRTVYDLLSVICHNGSPSDGHYTIYALNSSDNLWYEFNDQDVTTVDIQTVASCEAYVLFYRKI